MVSFDASHRSANFCIPRKYFLIIFSGIKAEKPMNWAVFLNNYRFFVNNSRNIGFIDLKPVSFDADHKAANFGYPKIFVRHF